MIKTPNSIYPIFVIAMLLLLISCDKPEEQSDLCIKYQTASVNYTNSPSTGTVGESIDIEMGFVVHNGCGGFGSFVEGYFGNTITLEVIAKYTGCICTTNVPTRIVHYQFTPQISGTYYLKFKSGDDFITDTLTIN